MKKMIILIPVFFLFSCATSYHHKNFFGGYTDYQLEPDIFRVSFKGNSKTSIERAVDFALLRSAELTLKNGCKYFTVLYRDQYIQEDWVYTHHYYPSIVEKPRVYFTIKCFAEKPDCKAFDADKVIASLKDKYNLKDDIVMSSTL